MIIDVSKHQGVVDWDTVKPHIDGAILRMGYGTDIAKNDDETFERNYDACKRLGIPIGVYLYSYAKTADAARSEATHALRLLSGKTIEGHVWFDSEQRGTERIAATACSIFYNRLTAQGFKVGIYAGEAWFNKYLKTLPYPLWIAKYGLNTGKQGKRPSVGRDVYLWQYTSRATVPGIKGKVDASIFLDGAKPAEKPNSDSKPAEKPLANNYSGKAGYEGMKTLRMGDTGQQVKTLQALLGYKFGYATTIKTIDGRCGDATGRCVLDFQKDHGLTIDGVVGSNTWKALLN